MERAIDSVSSFRDTVRKAVTDFKKTVKNKLIRQQQVKKHREKELELLEREQKLHEEKSKSEVFLDLI